MNKIFNREICVCAHVTQTRHAQKACAEMRGIMEQEIRLLCSGYGAETGSDLLALKLFENS